MVEDERIAYPYRQRIKADLQEYNSGFRAGIEDEDLDSTKPYPWRRGWKEAKDPKQVARFSRL